MMSRREKEKEKVFTTEVSLDTEQPHARKARVKEMEISLLWM